jgi:hypothetical protein
MHLTAPMLSMAIYQSGRQAKHYQCVKYLKIADSPEHCAVVHGNLSQVTRTHLTILDLAQHAMAVARSVLLCQTHSLLSQKLIPVRNALLDRMEPTH